MHTERISIAQPFLGSWYVSWGGGGMCIRKEYMLVCEWGEEGALSVFV